MSHVSRYRQFRRVDHVNLPVLISKNTTMRPKDTICLGIVWEIGHAYLILRFVFFLIGNFKVCVDACFHLICFSLSFSFLKLVQRFWFES